MSQELEVAENIATTPQQQNYKGSQFRFTTANARELAEKSRLSRLARLQREAQDKAELTKLAEKGKELLLANALQEKPAPAIEPDDLYRLNELKRVREGLDALWSDFYRTTDTKERKFIADSLKALSAMEFDLAKRPKPAAYRTAPEKPKRPSQQSGPVDAD